MNWILIIAVLVLIWRIAEGFKRGMVKEIISFISLLVMCVAVTLLGCALSNYFEKDIVSMVAAIILFLVLCIAHRLLSLLFFSAKVISKLPVVHSLDKLLGVVIGILETILIIWTIYTLILTFGMGMIGQQILSYVQESRILTVLYEHNYLAKWIGTLTDKVAILPF